MCDYRIESKKALAGLPLRVHARYRRDEILAGLGWATLDRLPTSMMQGVIYLRERQTVQGHRCSGISTQLAIGDLSSILALKHR